MKLGVISDLHGNIVALNKVLEEFEKQKVEKIICCGDIIGIGGFPEETVQRLMSIKEKLIIVRGNHEKYLLRGIPMDVHDEKRKIKPEEINNHKWTHSRLSSESISFIKELPVEQFVQIEEKTIYIVHYPINKNYTYKKHIKKANSEEIQELFKDKNADIYFYGHTHFKNINKTDNKMYINPGSLGCPGASSSAKCGILTINKGKATYQELEVEYPKKNVIEDIKNLEYPLYKKFLMIFYGDKDQIVQLLGETANVEDIQNTEFEDVKLGRGFYNCDEIGAYVIGAENNKNFRGKIYGILFTENDEKIIVANKELDYATIKEYFKEYAKSVKFRCLYEKSAGAIVYRIIDNIPQYLIIYSKRNIAGFPKGHIEAGENEEQTAKREIFEEVGIKADFKKGFKEIISYKIDDTPINKEVVFFLAEISNETKINIDKNEVNKYEFMNYEKARNVLKENTKEILEKALQFSS